MKSPAHQPPRARKGRMGDGTIMDGTVVIPHADGWKGASSVPNGVMIDTLTDAQIRKGGSFRVLGTLEQWEARISTLVDLSDEDGVAEFEPGDTVHVVALFGAHPQAGQRARILHAKHKLPVGYIPLRMEGGALKTLHWSSLVLTDDSKVDEEVMAATRKGAAESGSSESE